MCIKTQTLGSASRLRNHFKCASHPQVMLRQAQDVAITMRREADVKKRIREAKQR